MVQSSFRLLGISAQNKPDGEVVPPSRVNFQGNSMCQDPAAEAEEESIWEVSTCQIWE